jgi:hypothetical protein
MSQAGPISRMRDCQQFSQHEWHLQRFTYKTVFDRMAALGLSFAGRQYPNGSQADPWPDELPVDNQNVPTFKEGATLDELMALSGWQAHSVRGFLSATIRKRLNLPRHSDVKDD